MIEYNTAVGISTSHTGEHVALVVTPGHNFNRPNFFETCSHNRGFSVNAYTDNEKAIRRIIKAEI